MDNRINEIRRKISVVRAGMPTLEREVRLQVSQDQDCTDAALRLLAMRRELALLVAEWRAAGGNEPLPTLQERLKGKPTHGRP
jgi:chorismate mutase